MVQLVCLLTMSALKVLRNHKRRVSVLTALFQLTLGKWYCFDWTLPVSCMEPVASDLLDPVLHLLA